MRSRSPETRLSAFGAARIASDNFFEYTNSWCSAISPPPACHCFLRFRPQCAIDPGHPTRRRRPDHGPVGQGGGFQSHQSGALRDRVQTAFRDGDGRVDPGRRGHSAQPLGRARGKPSAARGQADGAASRASAMTERVLIVDRTILQIVEAIMCPACPVKHQKYPGPLVRSIQAASSGSLRCAIFAREE